MHKISKILFLAYVALVFYLTLLPQENFTELSTFRGFELFFKIENFDKLVHFGMFGLMTILLFWSYKISNLRLIYIPFLISLFIEILQGTITVLHRGADFVDLMANLSGITISYILITVYIKNKKTQQN